MSEDVATPSPSRSARARAATRELRLDRLARFPFSGLTVAQSCALEAVSLPTFYSWKRRLASPQGPATDPEVRLLPVQLSSPSQVVELVLGLVRCRLQADPLSWHLFIFHNRSADRLKVLYW